MHAKMSKIQAIKHQTEMMGTRLQKMREFRDIKNLRLGNVLNTDHPGQQEMCLGGNCQQNEMG